GSWVLPFIPFENHGSPREWINQPGFCVSGRQARERCCDDRCCDDQRPDQTLPQCHNSALNSFAALPPAYDRDRRSRTEADQLIDAAVVIGQVPQPVIEYTEVGCPVSVPVPYH